MGSRSAMSTDGCAARRTPATTRRCGSSSRCRRGLEVDRRLEAAVHVGPHLFSLISLVSRGNGDKLPTGCGCSQRLICNSLSSPTALWLWCWTGIMREKRKKRNNLQVADSLTLFVWRCAREKGAHRAISGETIRGPACRQYSRCGRRYGLCPASAAGGLRASSGPCAR